MKRLKLSNLARMLLLVSGVLLVAVAIKVQTTDAQRCRFCGDWEYYDKASFSKGYLRLEEVSAGRYRLIPGYQYNGQIVWQTDLYLNGQEAIYLSESQGRMSGSFISANFRPTRGRDSKYTILCEIDSTGNLRYRISYAGVVENQVASRMKQGTTEPRPATTSRTASNAVNTPPVLSRANVAAPSKVSINAPHMNSSEAEVLARWLSNGWRPAAKADALRGKNAQQRQWVQEEMAAHEHHPFYLSRDFNRDGYQDFAVMLTTDSRPARWSLAIFNGPFPNARVNPTFQSADVQDGDFIFWFQDRFVIGSPGSDSGWGVVPRGKRYVKD